MRRIDGERGALDEMWRGEGGWGSGLRLVELSDPAEDTPFDFRAALVISLPQLRSLASRLTPCAADASDLVQETCLRAIEKQHQFVRGSPDDLVRWLRTIMHHLRRDDLTRELGQRLH